MGVILWTKVSDLKWVLKKKTFNSMSHGWVTNKKSFSSYKRTQKRFSSLVFVLKNIFVDFFEEFTLKPTHLLKVHI